MSDRNRREDEIFVGVDRAALIFAATAGAVTVATGSGDWTMISTFIGVLLCTIVLAFHRATPLGVIRAWFVRFAFGFTFSLCLAIAIAYPIQQSGVRGALNDPRSVGIWLFGAGLVVGLLEPRIVRLLDRKV
jgi:hypothetical protein